MICTKCEAEYTAKTNRHGSYCKPCKREYQRIWYKKSKCKSRDPESVMLSNAKERARKKGIPFNLTLDDINIPKDCPALGVALVVGSVGGTDSSPSIDRINPRKGYVKGNVAVISLRANRIKSNATFSEIRSVANWLKKVSS